MRWIFSEGNHIPAGSDQSCLFLSQWSSSLNVSMYGVHHEQADSPLQAQHTNKHRVLDVVGEFRMDSYQSMHCFGLEEEMSVV